MAKETHKEYTYKEQADGSDSWRVDEYEDDKMKGTPDSYMVYADPDIVLTLEQRIERIEKTLNII